MERNISEDFSSNGCGRRRGAAGNGHSRAHLLVRRDDVDVELAGRCEGLDDLDEPGRGDAVVVDHQHVRAPRGTHVASVCFVNHFYSPGCLASAPGCASVSRFLFTESAFVQHALRRVSRPGTSVRLGLERVKPPRSSRGFDVARYEMVSPKREWMKGRDLERNTRNDSRIDRQKYHSALASGSQPRIFPRAVSFPTRKSPLSEFSHRRGEKLKK